MTDAEDELLRAVQTADSAICSPNDNPEAKENDPRTHETWPERRRIRASLIRWICLNSPARALVDPKGIQVFGAMVSGILDLTHVIVPFPLTFLNCQMMDPINLWAAHIPELDLGRTCINSLYAYRAKIDGSLFMRDRFCASDQVRIRRRPPAGTSA